MNNITAYDRETLIRIIESYAAIIERHNDTGKKYPAAVLSDILHSARAVAAEARKQ